MTHSQTFFFWYWFPSDLSFFPSCLYLSSFYLQGKEWWSWPSLYLENGIAEWFSLTFFFKKSLTSHCSLHVGSALYLWFIAPCPHFSSLSFFSPLALLHSMWVLSSQLGIEPARLALKGQRLNHWTAREVPQLSFFIRWNCFSLCPPCLYASVSSLNKTFLPSFFASANLPFWNNF